MNKIWVLVAESSRAKLYEQDHPRSPLHELKDFEHSASRLNDTELVAGSLGRTHDRYGYGQHALVPDTDPKANEAHIFARELAEHLDQSKKFYSKLVVIAPPEFLGLLRDSFSSQVAHCVAASINKNLVHETPEEIQGHLPYSF